MDLAPAGRGLATHPKVNCSGQSCRCGTCHRSCQTFIPPVRPHPNPLPEGEGTLAVAQRDLHSAWFALTPTLSQRERGGFGCAQRALPYTGWKLSQDRRGDFGCPNGLFISPVRPHPNPLPEGEGTFGCPDGIFIPPVRPHPNPLPEGEGTLASLSRWRSPWPSPRGRGDLFLSRWRSPWPSPRGRGDF